MVATSCGFESHDRHQIKGVVDDKTHYAFYLYEVKGTRKISIAICRRHVAATSSKTGGYLSCRPFPDGNANESHHRHHLTDPY